MSVSGKSIFVTGAEGQLGSELCRQLGSRAIGWTRSDCDLSDSVRLSQLLDECSPDVIINTAAYTAVDRAETEATLCYAINADAVNTLAQWCRSRIATLIQVSTDYVFGGDQTRSEPYKENNNPAPLNVYGQSKLAGESYAANAGKYFVVRTCGLYGTRAKPTQSNFVDTMLRLAEERDHLRVVSDQHCTPSYSVHVAKGILQLAETQAYGLYHLINAGSTTWHEFAAEIFRLVGKEITVDAIPSSEYKTAAERPCYSVLSTEKLGKLGIQLPHWRSALREYLESRGLVAH